MKKTIDLPLHWIRKIYSPLSFSFSDLGFQPKTLNLFGQLYFFHIHRTKKARYMDQQSNTNRQQPVPQLSPPHSQVAPATLLGTPTSMWGDGECEYA